MPKENIVCAKVKSQLKGANATIMNRKMFLYNRLIVSIAISPSQNELLDTFDSSFINN